MWPAIGVGYLPADSPGLATDWLWLTSSLCVDIGVLAHCLSRWTPLHALPGL